MKQNATPDSSFWINAHHSGLLPYVLDRFQLHYTPAVGLELREEFSSGREFWELARRGVLVAASSELEVVTEFGPGERAAMNLTLEHRDWVLLMDDRRPFMEAGRLGLRVLCTPVLVVDLYMEEKLNARQALEVLGRLAALQTVSPNLLAASLAHLGAVWKEQERG